MKDQLKAICIITILCNLPISIGNIYFFFMSPDAYSWNSSHELLDINVKQWLGISGFTQILYILIYFLFLLDRICSEELDSCSLLTITIIKLFDSIFMVCWLIIGSIINWDKTYKNISLTSLFLYLSIMIIVQYILIAVDWIGTIIFMRKKFKEQFSTKRSQNTERIPRQDNQSNNQLIK